MCFPVDVREVDNHQTGVEPPQDLLCGIEHPGVSLRDRRARRPLSTELRIHAVREDSELLLSCDNPGERVPRPRGLPEVLEDCGTIGTLRAIVPDRLPGPRQDRRMAW